jgi:hypothetical protein
MEYPLSFTKEYMGEGLWRQYADFAYNSVEGLGGNTGGPFRTLGVFSPLG